MRELNVIETEKVSGGIGPSAIIGIDLALNGILLAWASLAYSTNGYKPKKPPKKEN